METRYKEYKKILYITLFKRLYSFNYVQILKLWLNVAVKLNLYNTQ